MIVLRALFAPLLSALLAFAAAPAAASPGFAEHITAWDLEGARKVIGNLAPGPQRQAFSGILAVYEADYPGAESLLTAALSSPELTEDPALVAEARHFLALARGARRALGPAITLRSPDGRIEAVFADAKDTLLAPYLFAAMADARRVLDPELGISPTTPIRFEILDDPAKLALVSPLTLDNIYATGTIGITKYRRIVMISPRMLLHGYPWLDTAVHEYVHYLITLRTRNRAPVWLQEGLAKLLETRWRSDATPPLPLASQRLLHTAIATDDLVSIAEMSPSIAMLPSQKRAAIAYAEVETMLRFLREERGDRGIIEILDRVREGEDAEAALASAWGASFDEFMAAWKADTRKQTAAAAKSDASLKERRFHDGELSTSDPSLHGELFAHLGGGRAQQHARLGVLLLLRGHPRAAAEQLERARRADARARRDPKLARHLGEIYLELDDPSRALPLLEIAAAADPEHANLATAEGRARLALGDHEGARLALARAIRINPLIPAIHCALAELAEDPEESARERALCHRR